MHEIDAASYDESNQYIYIEINSHNQKIFTKKKDDPLLVKIT